MTGSKQLLLFNELGNKYADIGLTIDIEFNRWGMIFRGCWYPTPLNTQLMRFNRQYTYDFIRESSDEITLEFLIDEFKKEFETKLQG